MVVDAVFRTPISMIDYNNTHTTCVSLPILTWDGLHRELWCSDGLHETPRTPICACSTRRGPCASLYTCSRYVRFYMFDSMATTTQTTRSTSQGRPPFDTRHNRHQSQLIEFILPTFLWDYRINSTPVQYVSGMHVFYDSFYSIDSINV